MPLLKGTVGFGDMEVTGDLHKGCFSGTMAGTPDCSGPRTSWEAGSNQPFKSLAVRERVAIGQQLEGGMRPRGFKIFFVIVET